VFLKLATLSQSKIGLHEKTLQFMDLLGNTKIRPQTIKTLKSVVEKLHRLSSALCNKFYFISRGFITSFDAIAHYCVVSGPRICLCVLNFHS